MNADFHRESKKYLKKISSMLPGCHSNRKHILKCIEKNLDLCIKEHPADSWDDILKEFGSAEEVAAFAISEYSEENAASVLQKQKQVHIFMLFIVMAFLILSATLIGYIFYVRKNTPNYKDGVHYYIEGTEVSPEKYFEENEIRLKGD